MAVAVAIFAAAIFVAGSSIEPEQSIMMTWARWSVSPLTVPPDGHRDDRVDHLAAGRQVLVLVHLDLEGRLLGFHAIAPSGGGAARRWCRFRVPPRDLHFRR